MKKMNVSFISALINTVSVYKLGDNYEENGFLFIVPFCFGKNSFSLKIADNYEENERFIHC